MISADGKFYRFTCDSYDRRFKKGQRVPIRRFVPLDWDRQYLLVVYGKRILAFKARKLKDGSAMLFSPSGKRVLKVCLKNLQIAGSL